jgi:hypothetical protein
MHSNGLDDEDTKSLLLGTLQRLDGPLSLQFWSVVPLFVYVFAYLKY